MKKNKKSLLYLLPFIMTTFLLSVSWQLSRSQSNILTTPKQNDPLPAINLPTLQKDPLPSFNLPPLLQSSKPITTKMFQGQISILNIWASWCSACQAEQPILMTIKKHYSTPIYGINFKDNTEDAKTWLTNEGNPYTAIGVDESGSLSTILDINGIPETILLDKHGMIRYRYKGALSMDAWEGTLLPIIEHLMHEQ